MTAAQQHISRIHKKRATPERIPVMLEIKYGLEALLQFYVSTSYISLLF